MKSFQVLCYVFGLVVAIGVVAGQSAKIGELNARGATEEWCSVGPDTAWCPDNGPNECPHLHCKPSSFSWTLTHEGYVEVEPDYPDGFDEWSENAQYQWLDQWLYGNTQCMQDFLLCVGFQPNYELKGLNCFPYAVGN